MLKKTRQAIVEEFMKSHNHLFVDDNINWTNDELLGFANDLTQALNDYTQIIIEMVEGKERKLPGAVMSNHPESVRDFDTNSGYNQALNDIKEELQK